MAAVTTDNLKLSDGTTMDLARVPDVDDATWDEVKQYLEGNPDMARNLQKFAKDPDAVRGWMQTQIMAKHYQEKLETDTKLQEQMKSLEHDAEFAAMFEDIKKNGFKKMGGLPSELAPQLKKLDETPLNFHEACKLGDLKAVQACIDKKQPLDTQDHKGITPLGYAIGANRIASIVARLQCRKTTILKLCVTVVAVAYMALHCMPAGLRGSWIACCIACMAVGLIVGSWIACMALAFGGVPTEREAAVAYMISCWIACGTVSVGLAVGLPS